MKSFAHKTSVFISLLAVLGALLFIQQYLSITQIEKIKNKGELIVITRNSPTTHFIDNNGPAGFEYELAKKFADHLGVQLTVIVQNEFHKILPTIVDGKAHIGAAGITHTKQRESYIDFGPDYFQVTSQIAYKGGQKRPKSIKDLQDKNIAVIKGSTHALALMQQKEAFPQLNWEEYPDLNSEELLKLVSDGLLDYTIADSNELASNRRYFPNLRVGFNLGEEESLAWAFQKSDDKTLQDAAVEFFAQIENDGTLHQLKEKYFGHVDKIRPVDSHTFIKNARKRLPKYEKIFREAALEYDMDWRFLAAVSYQESLWNSKAVSPTGVKGLMMLTNNTALQLKIKNRRDPVKSVHGGTKYYLSMHKKIPARIGEPDRTWFALAAYNVGFGHLEDARILAQRAGLNPDLWSDVKKYLPLLSKKKWYEQTKHGYARGREPVTYVQNIRNYYDLLVWLDHKGEINSLVAQN